MITKTNEKIVYKGTYVDEDHQISANITTSIEGTLSQIDSGTVVIEDQNVADFSLSSSDYLFINCYSSENATVVAEYIDAFINQVKDEENYED